MAEPSEGQITATLIIPSMRDQIFNVVDRLHEVGLDCEQIAYALDIDVRVIEHICSRGENYRGPQPQTNG